MKKTTEEMAAKIKELIEAGKSDTEIMTEMDAFLDSEDEEPSDKDDPKVPVSKQLPKQELKEPVKSSIKAKWDNPEELDQSDVDIEKSYLTEKITKLKSRAEYILGLVSKATVENVPRIKEELMLLAKFTNEINGLFNGGVESKIKAAIKDMSEDEIRSIAAETADNLREFNVMNGLLENEDTHELADACDKVYAWLYDQAWMVPKDGWKVESKIKAEGEEKKLPKNTKGDIFELVKETVEECSLELTSAIQAMDEEKERRKEGFSEYEQNVYNHIDKAMEELDGADKNFDMIV
jgi:hypothetical protein